jgi:hypothetical protein
MSRFPLEPTMRLMMANGLRIKPSMNAAPNRDQKPAKRLAPAP